jgi:hypothetical protein
MEYKLICVCVYAHTGYSPTPVIPALRRVRKEDHKFEVNLGYTVRPCLKNRKKEKKRKRKLISKCEV